MKGRLIAFSNVLTFTAVLCAAGLPSLLTSLAGFTTAQVILSTAFLTVGRISLRNEPAAGFFRPPDSLARSPNTIYRVRAVGESNVPREGALFVANHTSWVDFLLIGAACDRMIRFLMFRTYYEWPALNWFFRRMGAIPVAAGDPPSKTEESLAIARRQIRRRPRGVHLRRGRDHAHRQSPQVQARLREDRLAASTVRSCRSTSRASGGASSATRAASSSSSGRRGSAGPMTVVFGAPLPSSDQSARRPPAHPGAFGRGVRGTARNAQQPLAMEFLRAARRYGAPPAARRRRVLALSASARRLVQAVALRRSVLRYGARERRSYRHPASSGHRRPRSPTSRPRWRAASPVNLDADAARRHRSRDDRRDRRSRPCIDSSRAFSSRPRRCRSSRAAPDRRRRPRSHATRRFAARRGAVIAAPRSGPPPARFFTTTHDVDRVATILFSYPRSRRTVPRGALLSHHNLLANLEALRQVLDVSRGMRSSACCRSPNAMSFATTLWLPVLSGGACRLRFDRLHEGLGELCRRRARVARWRSTPPLLASLTAVRSAASNSPACASPRSAART